MEIEEVKRLFPNSVGFRLAPSPDEAGVIDPVKLGLLDWHTRAEAFRGVMSMALRFTDGRVTAIGVAYRADTRWPSVSDFTTQVSKALALPVLAWREPKNADPANARVMDCDGFRVVASVAEGEPPVLALVDTKAEKLVKDRRATVEEKKRQSFKP